MTPNGVKIELSLLLYFNCRFNSEIPAIAKNRLTASSVLTGN